EPAPLRDLAGAAQRAGADGDPGAGARPATPRHRRADHRRGARAVGRDLARRHPLLARDPRPLVLRQSRRRRRPARGVLRARVLMRPIGELPPAVARELLGVFTDIADTLPTDGRLPAASYGALEQLAAAGLAVVPITGRPAG